MARVVDSEDGQRKDITAVVEDIIDVRTDEEKAHDLALGEKANVIAPAKEHKKKSRSRIVRRKSESAAVLTDTGTPVGEKKSGAAWLIPVPVAHDEVPLVLPSVLWFGAAIGAANIGVAAFVSFVAVMATVAAMQRMSVVMRKNRAQSLTLILMWCFALPMLAAVNDRYLLIGLFCVTSFSLLLARANSDHLSEPSQSEGSSTKTLASSSVFPAVMYGVTAVALARISVLSIEMAVLVISLLATHDLAMRVFRDDGMRLPERMLASLLALVAVTLLAITMMDLGDRTPWSICALVWVSGPMAHAVARRLPFSANKRGFIVHRLDSAWIAAPLSLFALLLTR